MTDKLKTPKEQYRIVFLRIFTVKENIKMNENEMKMCKALNIRYLTFLLPDVGVSAPKYVAHIN